MTKNRQVCSCGRKAHYLVSTPGKKGLRLYRCTRCLHRVFTQGFTVSPQYRVQYVAGGWA